MTNNTEATDNLIHAIAQGMHANEVHLTDQIIEGLRSELATAHRRLALIDGIVAEADVIDRKTRDRLFRALWTGVDVPAGASS